MQIKKDFLMFISLKTKNPALFLETRGFSIQSILPSHRVKGFRILNFRYQIYALVTMISI